MSTSTPVLSPPRPAPAPSPRVNARRFRSTLGGQGATLVLVIVALAVVLQISNPAFLSSDNVITLLRSAVTTFVIGCAATVVFTSGGLDLSSGAVFNLGGITTGLLLAGNIPWPIAIVGGLGAGAAVGLLNAVIILYGKVPAIIATLATFFAIGGVAVVITDGNPIAPLPKEFTAIGQGSIAGVPLLIVYAVAVGVVFHLLLAHTRFGYNVKSVGGNEFAALANGVRVRRVKSTVYILSGAVAALAGILYAARIATADPQAGGADLTFNVMTAVLIGGTSLFGGVGSIAGTAAGAVLFGVIQNGLTLVGVNPLYSNIVIGAILAAAVALDSWRRGRAFRVGTHKKK